ncbi:hypothetical protein EVA_01207 [gut metagenome]|uniref:Uncharacterized protein n=1 Tax=gut metagenome TaxID=749906 RepID=J9H800_9ZZZZ
MLREVHATTTQLPSFNVKRQLGKLSGTFVQIHSIEVVFQNQFRYITTRIVRSEIIHLVLIQLIEHLAGIKQKVTTTTSWVNQTHIFHFLCCDTCHRERRRSWSIGYLVFFAQRGRRVHFQILFHQGVIHQELHHPMRCIDLTLQGDFIIFSLCPRIFMCLFLHLVEVLIEPA